MFYQLTNNIKKQKKVCSHLAKHHHLFTINKHPSKNKKKKHKTSAITSAKKVLHAPRSGSNT
jgi:hypothetical protein